MGNTISYQLQWPNDNGLECTGLSITLSPQMSFTLVGLYRPPTVKNHFFEQLNSSLKEYNFNKEVILMGDFNMNLEDKCSRHALNQITNKLSLTQVIIWAMRITQSSQTHSAINQRKSLKPLIW